MRAGSVINRAADKKKSSRASNTVLSLDDLKTSKCKPETAAMVLIDQQVGTAGLVRTIDSKVAIRNAAILAKTAIILGMPIVLTSSQEDNFQGPIATELQEAAPEAYARRVKRQGIVDAWEDPTVQYAHAPRVALGRNCRTCVAATSSRWKRGLRE